LKRSPAPFSGLLLVNKPKGPTSHDLVGKLRWCLGTRSVGHGGTLDPMAEGLMVLLIGEATKLSQWVTQASKDYSGEVTLGAETTTADAEGEVVQSFQKNSATLEEVESVFKSLLGEQELSVPKFSAIKQDGKKLYDLARSGKEVVCPKRIMNFYESEVKSVQGSKIEFWLSCSKGSYIRSWAVEVGKRLGSGAHLSSLKRTRIANFLLEQSQPLVFFESLKGLSSEDAFAAVKEAGCFVALSDALPTAEIVRMNPKEEVLFSNGQIPNAVRTRVSPLLRDAFRNEKSYLIRMLGSGGRLAGLVGVDHKGQMKIQRVFN
jgi:tRNA pseudouridine55 synthase